MKKTFLKRLLIVSSGFALVAAGCQTSQVSSKSGDRYPAFASKPQQQDPDPVIVEQPPVVIVDPVAPPVVIVQDPNPPIVVSVPPVDPTHEFIQISAVNGQVVASHAAVINVRPGDIIALTASVFLADNEGFSDESISGEDFVWSANGYANGTCDGDSSDCLLNSPFQATDYGVNFYVPNTMGPGQDIGIRVSDQFKSDAGVDSIILHVKNPPPKPIIIIAPVDLSLATYPCPAFSDQCSLNGQGNWVFIDGQRYFAPFIPDNTWQPYSHGYWTWVDGDGWTWVSYDQWGWYTDHYGYWRHHGVYGWIWAPYSDHHYVPHGVSWFYDGDHVGWYPYNDGYAQGYTWGAEHGFDDGYWAGRRDADFYDNYHPGFYHVNNRDFGQNDLSDHRSPDNVNDCYHASYDQHHQEPAYGRWPGGQDQQSSKVYVTNVVKVNVVVTKVYVTNITVKNTTINNTTINNTTINNNTTNNVMKYPLPVEDRPTPAKYTAINQENQRFNGKPIPVGAVVAQDRIVPPTTNGRGITFPPVVKSASGSFAPIKPIARTVAKPNQDVGIFHAPPPPAKAPPRPPVVPPQRQPAPQPQPKPAQPQPARPQQPPVVARPVTPPATPGRGNEPEPEQGNHPVVAKPVTPPATPGRGNTPEPAQGNHPTPAQGNPSQGNPSQGNRPVVVKPVTPPATPGRGNTPEPAQGNRPAPAPAPVVKAPPVVKAAPQPAPARPKAQPPEDNDNDDKPTVQKVAPKPIRPNVKDDDRE